MISINGLTVAYGGYTLLDSIDFHISEKDKIGLVGKNGAGKSTIMKLICGLQSPTSGSIDKPNASTVEVNIEMYEVSEIVFITSSLIL